MSHLDDDSSDSDEEEEDLFELQKQDKTSLSNKNLIESI
jgi:hypothetical protein